MKTRYINGIIIHCAATPNGRWHNVHEIDKWHQERGFSRDEAARQRFNPQLHAIGYHFVIYPNGANATGRDVSEIGAHAKNYNARTIGICLIGTDKFTRDQWWTLRDVVVLLRIKHPDARVIGHRDLPNVKKTCPGFNVEDWLKNGMEPLPGHILEYSL